MKIEGSFTIQGISCAHNITAKNEKDFLLVEGLLTGEDISASASKIALIMRRKSDGHAPVVIGQRLRVTFEEEHALG
jgi:hypothetical protein